MTKRVRIIRKVIRQPPEATGRDVEVVIPDARSDCREFFAKTAVLTERRPHHHFLVFVTSPAAVVVKVVDAARKLEEFPRSSRVMVQWPGTWRSDWFKTTVGEILDARR